MIEIGNSMENQDKKVGSQSRVPAARYAYYRRCQVFRKNGGQCKAPAEKGSHICHAHAGQLEMAVRRQRERRAVLAEVVAVMRRRGKPEFGMADIFMDFNAIQVALGVMAQALIDGRIDCKTAGWLGVNLQMASKLLRMLHGRSHKTLPLINTDDTDRKLARVMESPGLSCAKTGDVIAIRKVEEFSFNDGMGRPAIAEKEAA